MITTGCLQYLLGLTHSLQAEAKDIVQAVSEVKNVIATLRDVRDNVERHHNEWFIEVGKMCNGIDTTPSMPRLCSRQCHLPKLLLPPIPLNCRTITIPVLDHLLVELEKRFDTHQRTALLGFYLVPSLLVQKEMEYVSSKVLELGTLYAEDLPHPNSQVNSIVGTLSGKRIRIFFSSHLTIPHSPSGILYVSLLQFFAPSRSLLALLRDLLVG